MHSMMELNWGANWSSLIVHFEKPETQLRTTRSATLEQPEMPNRITRSATSEKPETLLRTNRSATSEHPEKLLRIARMTLPSQVPKMQQIRTQRVADPRLRHFARRAWFTAQTTQQRKKYIFISSFFHHLDRKPRKTSLRNTSNGVRVQNLVPHVLYVPCPHFLLSHKFLLFKPLSAVFLRLIDRARHL